MDLFDNDDPYDIPLLHQNYYMTLEASGNIMDITKK